MLTTGTQRAPPANIKCPPATQRKQAKRACIYIYIRIYTHILINRVLIVKIHDGAIDESLLSDHENIYLEKWCDA